jgi:hypothetical protein
VIYDPQAARFFVMILEVPRNDCSITPPPSSSYRSYLRVAVSSSDHPKTTSDWLHYSFDVTRVVDIAGVPHHYAPDYPAFAVDATCLTVAANYFEMPLPCRPSFGVGIITLSKAALLAGNATPLLSFSSENGEFALSPVSDLWGATPGGVTYLVEWPQGSTNTLRLWALSDPLGARTLSFTTLVIPDRGFAHPNMGVPQCAPASGSGKDLRSWAGTAQGIAQWADGSIWFCGTGTVADRMRVHFYRLAPNGYPGAAPVLQEAGVLDAGEGVWNFSPSIAATAGGDLGIVFTQSSATLCPRMMAALRPAGATEFHPPLVVASSPEFYANYDSGLNLVRWGDYAAVSVDPLDQSFWVGHMTGDAGQVWPQLASYNALNWHFVGRMIFEDLATGWGTSGRIMRSGQSMVQALGATSDGAGGVISLWNDRREPQPTHRLQRLTAAGAIASGWITNGTPAGVAANTPVATVHSDGAGGAYTVRGESASLVVNRFTADGQRSVGWPEAQVTVAANVGTYRAAAEGPTAVFVAWGATGGIRVQKVGGAGTLLWSPFLVTTTNTQAEVCPDGAGGVFVSWTASGHVIVKRVLASGSADPAWPANGIDLGTSTGSRLMADGAGGVFVLYSTSGDLRAIRLTSAGIAASGWVGGREVAVAPGNQVEQVIATDGADGVLVAWGDTRDASTSAEDIYVTRLDANGDRVSGWIAQGTRVSGAVGVQRRPTLATDGAGGAFVAWIDGRAFPECSGAGCGEDLYWSHVLANGQLDASIVAEGSPLSTSPGDQGEPVLTRASTGSAIATWLDGALVPDGDPAWFTRVFAQRLTVDVSTGDVGERPGLADGLGRAQPNPAVRGTTLHASIAEDHPGGQIRIEVFDVTGRVVRTLHEGPAAAGRHGITWDLRTDGGARVRPGLYFVRMGSPVGVFTRGVVVQ